MRRALARPGCAAPLQETFLSQILIRSFGRPRVGGVQRFHRGPARRL